MNTDSFTPLYPELKFYCTADIGPTLVQESQDYINVAVVARKREMRKQCRILVRKPQGKREFEILDEGRKIILQLMLGK